jgi:16S rRNA (uracil1498-N3)-methyltransferase
MPTIPRLFVDKPLAEGAVLSLGEEAANYLSRVLRLGIGGTARLFNGRDGEWLARIEAVGTRRIDLVLLRRTRAQPAGGGPQVRLLFAPVKKDETDLIVAKATELGAAAIWPVLTERTQTRTIRLDRFRRIALEAAEQTERLDLPEVADAVLLPRALEALKPDTALVYCDEAGDEAGAAWGGAGGRAAPALAVLQGLKGRPAAILVGPEGGFTPFERAGLRGRRETYPVSLGPRILRAESAAMAALALWQAVCGDWG